MIWQSGIDHHPWTDLVIRFGSWGKPMALLDENGSWRLSFPAGGRNRIRHFALAYPETAGLAMGRYLLRKGHRRIAYISPVHGSAWSVNRLKGLRRAFEEAGFMKAISAFTHDEFLLPADILEQQQNLRASIQMLLSKGEKSAVWSATARRALLKLHSKAAIVLEGEVYRERMVPLMEHALEHDDITAWVAADDETALKCLDFLEESRLKVPEKIAVVGFDDSIESCTRKLTTYDFNTPAYIRAMINHIIVPQRSVPSVNRRTEIEIGGSVIVRETA